MAQPPMVDHALAWAARGFPVFPLRRGGKKPIVEGWQELATTDPETIRRVWNGHDYNIGVHTRGLIIVDVDDKEGKTGSADWSVLGYPDDTLTIQTPSGGRHLYYRSAVATGQPALTKSIDIRAAGLGYVVAPGSVVDGKPYTILSDKPLADAPQSLVDHCHRRKSERGEVTVEIDTDEAEALATEYLKHRKGSPEGNRDNWTYVTACSVIDFGLSAELCFDLVLEWNNERNDPPLEEEAIRRIADSAWRNRLNPVGSSSIEAEFGAVNIPPPERKKRPRPKIMWAGDQGLDLTQQWLMYNRFPKIGTAMIVGPSGSGKTFLSLDFAVAMAEGREWLGRAGDEKVGAVILSAEGIGGLPARMKPLARVPVVATTVSLLGDERAAQELIDTVSELRKEILDRFGARLGIVIIDTLNSAGLLTNENDNAEIGRAIRVLERIAEAFECLVVVTHHPPKSGSGARGGGALHAGFDTVVEIFQEKRGRQRFVECTKGRDAPVGAWGSFILEPYTVEPDLSGRGRDITTQRVIYGSQFRNETSVKEPSPTRREAFDGAFDDVRAELKLETRFHPIPLEALEARFMERARSWKGSAAKSFKDCLEWAKDNGRVSITYEGDETYITEEGGES